MKTLWHFFRLIRPLNLAVIVLTMGVFQSFISSHQPPGRPLHFSDFSVFNPDGTLREPSLWDHPVFDVGFLLLVLCTVLIAAAGNIINDYFDVKADRVNKPEALIIDKYIKRRWAIVFNWVFNSLGLLIALYLGWKYVNWFIPVVALVTINMLWFYSMYFKRQPVTGNIMVALLTAMVGLYVLAFNLPIEGVYLSTCARSFSAPGSLLINPILAISVVAFFINLIREIVKDMADIKGDLLLGANTIPIRWGIRKTKWILVLLLIPLGVSLVVYLLTSWEIVFFLQGGTLAGANCSPDLISDGFKIVLLCSLIVSILLLASYVVLIVFNKRKYYLLSSNLLKLAMFFGLITPLFL